MNAAQFLTWMRNPGKTSREESAQLDALLDAFPYFQSGHLLYIKNLHNQGSFLYNNQLKTAAAYAVNRKVLYNLITLKSAFDSAQSDKQTADERRETGEQSAVEQSDSLQSKVGVVEKTAVEQSSAFGYAQSGKETKEKKTEEQVSEPLKFPPKKFTNDPDEWEAGMLRQLQLLHHWQQKTPGERRETGDLSSFDYAQGDKPLIQDIKGKPEEAEKIEEKKPDAKEEINTLLYVLVEPGQSEDLPEETGEEISSEVGTDENEPTQWEISSVTEKKEEAEPPIAVPSDPVQQEILVEAIHSTFELEVDSKLPTAEELKPFRIEPLEEETKPVEEPAATEEKVVEGFEKMSFGEWLKEVNRKVPAELPKTALSGDKLIEQFIKEEPRINVKKSGFFNPVNMAKKSVQDSDEFITETLARIYAKQGNYSKAIRAYQKLSLKFPEKTAYFAALIEELKRTPNK